MDHRAAPAPPAETDTTTPTAVALPRGCGRRRALVAGAVGLGAVPLLAACGSSGSSGSGGESNSSGSSDDSSEGASGGTAEGIATSDIPVGGGMIYADQELVVTQPTEGDFKAFSAVCTHQQCLVTEVTDAGIDCSCHGSVFSLEDGSVLEGPAEEALPAKQVSVEGDTLTVT